jgi:thiamine-monophosphate kinase
MRSLGDLGEFGLIERIRRASRGQPKAQVVLGIGDDAALIRPRAGEDLVVSADTLVEDVHFRWRTQPASRIGQRALIVNLSDLAAMGARPLGFTLALAAPPELEIKRVDGLLRGLLKSAIEHACPLVGGNLARSRETLLAVPVLGAVARGSELRRHRVRKGDRLFVTGTLGGPALALARSAQTGALSGRLPTPRLAAGRALGRLGVRCSCIDLSDGLLADLGHLLEGSGLGAKLDLATLPLARGLVSGCRKLGLDPQQLALSGGEDYELLFALPGRDTTTQASLERKLGVQVTEIGRLVSEPGLHGVPALAAQGWRHF